MRLPDAPSRTVSVVPNLILGSGLMIGLVTFAVGLVRTFGANVVAGGAPLMLLGLATWIGVAEAGVRVRRRHMDGERS